MITTNCIIICYKYTTNKLENVRIYVFSGSLQSLGAEHVRRKIEKNVISNCEC